MRIVSLLEIAFLVTVSVLMARQAMCGGKVRTQFSSDTLSTRVPRYLRQGHRSYLALVRCARGEVRLKGTRSEKTDLALSILTTNLSDQLPKPFEVAAEFFSSGPAIMEKGRYYLILLTENKNESLEAQPFGFIDFTISNQVYCLTDYFEVAEKDAHASYEKTLLLLNKLAKPTVARGKTMDKTELATAFTRIQTGMTAAEVEAVLGAPGQVQGAVWYYSERRAPAVGENIPVYQVRFANDRVVSTSMVPGADATGPAPR